MRIRAEHGTDYVILDQIEPEDFVLVTVGDCGITVTIGGGDDDDDEDEGEPFGLPFVSEGFLGRG